MVQKNEMKPINLISFRTNSNSLKTNLTLSLWKRNTKQSALIKQKIKPKLNAQTKCVYYIYIYRLKKKCFIQLFCKKKNTVKT